MNWKEFIDKNLLNSKKSLFHFVSFKEYLDKRFYGIFDKMISETAFLPFETLIRERLYYLYHNLFERKKCEICNTNFLEFIDFKRGYRLTCSKNCYKKYQKIIQENGKSVAENRCFKSLITFLKSGKQQHRSEAMKNAKLKRKNGETKVKIKKVRKKPKKLTRFTGEFKEIAQKISSSISKIGCDGLTGYERGKLNGSARCKVLKYNDTHLYFQGNAEKIFLDIVNEINLLTFLENGLILKYYDYDNKLRTYRADFNCNKIIFEIKSMWTYDGRGSNIKLRITSNLKAKSAIENGYRYFFIYNNNFFTEVTLDKLQNIENNLLNEKNILTKDFLKKIITEHLNESRLNTELQCVQH